MDKLGKLGVVGGGVMGAALIKGVIKGGLLPAEEIYLVETDPLKLSRLRTEYGIGAKDSLAALALECRVIIIAVKPSVVPVVFKELGPKLDKNHLALSIAAGVSLASLEGLAPKARFVRVMPNTPARIGKGISAYSLGSFATAQDKEITEAIFGCLGKVLETPESQLHVITALSGSGPAYVYYFIEALIDAGVMLGLNREVAAQLVTETFAGSAELLKITGEHPAKLRNDVTSAGGTTAAGLFELEKGAVTGALMKAIVAATERSKQLAER
ncbi:MAG: pyrroline-5-carboxylate reductase [Firmicutes bacterium]|nr:pyrroline-5-carboxylate reductase [Bacillota bacterium]